MATLAADKKRAFEVVPDKEFGEIPIIASDIVYEGAAVGESSSSGTGRPLVGGDTFLGFAARRCDNASGSASAKNIHVYQRGSVQLAVTGVSSTADVGATVYATDDDTFTLTASGASAIGKVLRWITSTSCIVRFEGAQVRSI